MLLLQNLAIICASLAAGLIPPVLAASSSSASAAEAASIFLPSPVLVTSSSASPSSSSLSSSSSSFSSSSFSTTSSRSSSALPASSPPSSPASPSSAPSTSSPSASAESTIATNGPPVSVVVTVTIDLVIPTLTPRTVKTATGSLTSAKFVGSVITSVPGLTSFWVACPGSVKPTECGVHTGMKVWEGTNSYGVSFTIEQDGTQPFWSMRQYCTLTSSSYTCTNIVTGQTDVTTFALSQYYKLKVPVGLTGGVEKLVPPQDQYYSYNPTITILITNTPSISTNTLSNSTKPTTINSSTTTVIPLHFPIVTKDAKDKDIHWGASLANVDTSEIATYTVKCIDPKKAAIKDCESFYHGGITVQTGPMYYGYNFMYTVGSEWHTKHYHCHHPLSPGALKNGQDDIGICTSIYGPTDAPTTKVSTRVTSISASLANITPVTVTAGARWVPKPTETNGKAEGEDSGAVRMGMGPLGMRMGMGIGGDIGAVVVAGLVGVVVGVLGLVL